MTKNEKYLTLLMKVAETSKHRAKLAAAIVLKNEIISIGVNSLKTHPLQAKFGRDIYSVHIHAEIDAIVKALRLLKPSDLKKATLYVARIKHDRAGNLIPGLAKPCTGCMQAITSFGIKKVIWSNN